VLDSLMKQPDEIGGIGTQSVYVAVDDVEAHFKHARAAGAKIVLEFGSDEAGDRAYAASDLEGHIWNFGAYSPWPAIMPQRLAPAAEPAYAGRPSLSQAVLGGAVATLAIASVAAVALFDPPMAAPKFAARPIAPAAAPVTGAPELAQEAASLRDTLERESHARQEAARVAAAVREELSREKAARLAAEAARADLEQELSRSRQERAATDKAAPPATAAAPALAVPPPVLAIPASPPPAPAATAAAPATAPEPPSTTGSLADPSRDGVNQTTAAEPPPPVTIVPPPAAADAAAPAPPAPPPAAKKADKPRPARQTRAPQKKPPQRKGGNDPFFMYD
jgi:hypothetical protein